ncbi:MAG: AraC family transcriptional regulator [Clostridia bacterium]|nr:AraC family transcriptional regulator [Clostridia bacterium]
MKINEYYYHLQGKDNFVTKNHTHNEIEFIEVLSGSGTVLKDDRAYILQSRFLYIIDARKPHIINPINCDEYVRNKIVINADAFFSILSSCELSAVAEQILTSPPIPTQGDMEFDRLFATVAELCGSGDSTAAGLAWGYVLQMIERVLFSTQKKTVAAGEVTMIKEALNVIAQKEGMTTLSEISAILHVNKYYLCHLFKQETGITLSEYLAEKRYEKCVFYLTRTFYSIEQIAFLCGFASTSSLTRFFKHKSGICPKDFRKLHTNKITTE